LGRGALSPDAASEVASFYIPILLALGGLVLLVAWLPLVLKKAPLSLPILCVLVGMGIFAWTPFSNNAPHPIDMPLLVERGAELIVIISLMGAGLKLKRPFGWRSWAPTWRLLGVAMPLSILAFAVAGHLLLGLGTAAALLLGAALAPTDPVLASDVQIEGPKSPQDDEARFALTSEAGLNDSLAFPFVHLAVAASLAGFTQQTWSEWLVDAVLIRLTVGLIVGVALGWLFGWIVYKMPQGTELSRTGDGFVALGATLATYAVAEMAHGYGFLAVFLAGLMLRRAGRDHDYNQRMHDFADEVERLLMMAMLVLFGGMLIGGGLLWGLGWRELAFALIALFIVRPVIGWISLAGLKRPPLERFAISFFGIRGLGSVYYLAYGINHGAFPEPHLLWGTLALVVLISIMLHGVSVTPVMRMLDRSQGRLKPAPAEQSA
jgi:NhaP-type Na+/H+ or K+/H+ antiporter